ncbi:MAG: M48 family peptidase [Proteobacteria bacterium]|nr:M48 family peptidase [Pseudomonadota bacterium]
MHHLISTMPGMLVTLCLGLVLGCAPARPPVPPGTIPVEESLRAEDEQYGHEVLAELSRQYPLDRTDANINRVRDIVDRLTQQGLSSKNPWHVYVLVSDEFKNAAATRGNLIFVWTGLLNTVHNDAELATVLAHEIGHVLAGHTAPDPSQAVAEIIGSATGEIAGQVLASRGIPGILGQLAGDLLQAGLEAAFINPGQRSREFEADLIGMFLMAKAGIDPRTAVAFWERVRLDPDFANSTFSFLSTHPSSDDRLEQLKKYLPDAERLFRGETAMTGTAMVERQPDVGLAHDESAGFALPSPGAAAGAELPRTQHRSLQSQQALLGASVWEVFDQEVPVCAAPETPCKQVGSLTRGTVVNVRRQLRRWLELAAPQEGYVESRSLAPNLQ